MIYSVKRTGYTLIEVLVAVSVFAVLITGILGIVTLTTKLFVSSSEHIVAVSLANEKIEFLKSLNFDDVGFDTNFLALDAGEPEGVVTIRDEVVSRNDKDYTVSTEIAEINGTQREVVVKVEWVAANGTPRDVYLATARSVQAKPKGCGVCLPGWSCEPTYGVCLEDSSPSPSPISFDCEPGLLCDDGSLCTVHGKCPSGFNAPAEGTGASCTPGQLCENGAICSLEGRCPVDACPTGECFDSDVCHNGFCYDPDWYEVTWPATDGSGPSSSSAMQCNQDICSTSADCPVPCQADGFQLVWQCERTWIPMCSYTSAFGNGRSEISRADGNLNCTPAPCPVSGQCVNGSNCAVLSSDTSCSTDEQCPLDEVCSVGTCRSLCPDASNVECGIYTGGFAKGCRVYPISGGAGGLDSCNLSTALTQITATLNGSAAGANDEVLEGDLGSFVDLVYTVTLSEEPIETVQVIAKTTNGSAEHESGDYNNVFTVLEFEAGDDEETFTVRVNGDQEEEIHENFLVTISAPRSNSYEVLVANSQHQVIILNDDVSFSIADGADVNEGSFIGENQAEFVITRIGSTAPSSDGTTLPARVIGANAVTVAGTATAGSANDYIAANTDFDFNPDAALNLVQTFFVDIVGDDVYENNETFAARLTSSDEPVSNAIAQVTILDDETRVSISAPASSAIEGDPPSNGTATFGLNLDRVVNRVVDVFVSTLDGLAISGEDYVSLSNAKYSFGAGQTSRSVNVRLIADTTQEPLPDEDFQAVIDRVDGASVLNSSATGFIKDDDTPVMTVRAQPLFVGEGAGTTRFYVTTDKASPFNVSARFDTVDSSATAGSDYVAVSNSTFSIAPGQTTSNDIFVNIIDDNLDENNHEYFYGRISNLQNSVVDGNGQTSVGIVDNDLPPPRVSLDTSFSSIGEEGGEYNFRALLDRASTDVVTVEFNTHDYLSGSPISTTAGDDYTSVNNFIISFDPGETTSANIPVTIVDDNLDESRFEYFYGQLTNPQNATTSSSRGYVAIVDND